MNFTLKIKKQSTVSKLKDLYSDSSNYVFFLDYKYFEKVDCFAHLSSLASGVKSPILGETHIVFSNTQNLFTVV